MSDLNYSENMLSYFYDNYLYSDQSLKLLNDDLEIWKYYKSSFNSNLSAPVEIRLSVAQKQLTLKDTLGINEKRV